MQVIPNIVPGQVPPLFEVVSGMELQVVARGAAGGSAAAAPASSLTTSHIWRNTNWEKPLHWRQTQGLSRAARRQKWREEERGRMASHAKMYDQWIGQLPFIESYKGGNLVVLPCQSAPPARVGGAVRGKCTDFSWQSRSRLMRLLGTLNRDVCGLPLFVTFTYPGKFVMDDRHWKNDLIKLKKRIEYKFPGAFFVWKLEPQQRGAPHFHVLLWGLTEADAPWIRQNWYEVVGSGDHWHLKLGADVQRVYSWRGVASYAAKYLGKTVDDLPEGWRAVGRWWGIHNRKALPVQKVVVRVEQAVCNSVRRVVRKFMEKTNGKRCKWLRPYKTWKCLLADRGDVLMGRLIEWGKRLIDPHPDEPGWIYEQ